jgi:hypothetical protein
MSWKICDKCGQQANFLSFCHVCDADVRFRITAFNDIAIFVECEKGHRHVYMRDVNSETSEIYMQLSIADWYDIMANSTDNPEATETYRRVADRYRKKLDELK